MLLLAMSLQFTKFTPAESCTDSTFMHDVEVRFMRASDDEAEADTGNIEAKIFDGFYCQLVLLIWSNW